MLTRHIGWQREDGRYQFIEHLIAGLWLDAGVAEHPARKDTPDAIKAVVQCQYAECILQLALYPAGAEALRADASMREVLSALRDKAWTDEAKKSAESTLMTLYPSELKTRVEAGLRLHVMVSYQVRAQPRRRSGRAALLD